MLSNIKIAEAKRRRHCQRRHYAVGQHTPDVRAADVWLRLRGYLD